MGQPTHVSSDTIESATTTADVVVTGGVTSGNMLLLLHCDNNATITAPAKQAGTGTIGAISTVGSAVAINTDAQMQLYKCQVTGTGTLTIRFTVNIGKVVSGGVQQIAPNGSDTLDVDGSQFSTVGTASVTANAGETSPTLTSVAASDYVFAGNTHDFAAVSPTMTVTAGSSTPTTGWGVDSVQASVVNAPIALAHTVGGQASNYICYFQPGGQSGTGGYIACTCAIKGTASGGAAAVVPPMRTLRGAGV